LFISWVNDLDCEAYIEQHITVEDEAIINKIEHEYGEWTGDENFRLSKAQRWWFVGQHRELGGEFFQEYPHTPESAFTAVHDGTYYARIWRDKGRVINKGLYDPALPVFVAYDLGVNDMMSLTFFQLYKQEFRIIDEYHNNGEGIEHYVKEMYSRGYEIEEIILPHDGNVFEQTAGMTRLEKFHELGVENITVLPKTVSLNDDIEQIRSLIPYIYMDAEKCPIIHKMWGRYEKKWDEINNTYKKQPLHNQWSNPADSVRYGGIWAIHYRNFKTSAKAILEAKKKQQKKKARKGMAL
jgi:hypothetical protein